MTTDDGAYELDILKKVISTYFDETVPPQEELDSLVSKRDEIVWKIATKIYSQSGHKVEFSVIRDVVNSQIEVLSKALQVAQEDQQSAEAENRRQSRLNELARKLDKSGRDKSMCDLFLKVQDIISKQLGVNLNELTLTKHLSYDLGADELDTVELAVALEEEFDIEIPEDMLGSVQKWPPSYSSNSLGDSEPVACTIGKLLDFIHKRVSPQEGSYQ